MKYTFEILGISPVLYFFSQHHKIVQTTPQLGIEYLGTHKCTLDALLESVEKVPLKRGWDLERVMDTVIDFWLNNSESIRYWKARLNDAGRENLLVTRVAELKSLRAEFESLLGKNY